MRKTEDIIKTIESKLVNVEATANTVMKTNGQEFHGIIVRESGKNISPTFYLERYPDYISDEEVADLIISEFKNLKEPDIDVTIKPDGKRITCQLINQSKNLNIIERCPHIDFLDMSLVFRYVFDSNESDRIASTLINNDLLKVLDMTIEELCAYSKQNISEPIIKSMCEFFPEEYFDGTIPLFVVTTKSQINGASVIAFQEIIDILADTFKSFYILPSSIHEVLLIPADYTSDTEYLVSMVREVNLTLEPSEFLSDNVYKYDAVNKQWEVIE